MNQISALKNTCIVKQRNTKKNKVYFKTDLKINNINEFVQQTNLPHYENKPKSLFLWGTGSNKIILLELKKKSVCLFFCFFRIQ